MYKNESVFSDYNCWDNFSNWDDDFNKVKNCYFDNKKDKNLIFIEIQVLRTFKYFFGSNNDIEDYNYLFLSPPRHVLFRKKLILIFYVKTVYLNFLKKNKNNNVIVLSLELHRYLEDENTLLFSKLFT